MDELRLDLDRPIGTFALSGEEAAIRLRAKQRTIRRSAIELVRGLGFTGASVREEARKLEASMLGGEPYDWQAVNRAYLRKNRGRLLPNTYKTYESCLEKLARYFADLELADFEPPIGTERLEEFVDDLWGNSASRTRAKNISVLKGFFEWATLTGRLHGDPARPIKPPKKRGVERTIFSRDQETAILASNDRRDRLGLHLLLKVGIRKGELQGVQFRHFDHAHKRLTVFRKGGKVQTVPVVDPAFWDDLERHILDWSAQPNDYLLCRRSVRPNRHRPGEKFVTEYRGEPMGVHGLHKWWYACLARAGVVAEGQTAGEKMHKARHTAGQRVLDKTRGNILAVKTLLGHSSISTTADIYTDWNIDQLADTLREILDAEAER